ncbi:MAG: imidazolonepropionase [Candidatus Thermoplasmatota archaeon]|nr:imidazolonepropionase [Candidatus Thermoplasmatota archaeon]
MRLLLLNVGPIATLASGDVNQPLTGQDMSDVDALCLPRGNGIYVESGIISKLDDSEGLSHEFGKQNTDSLTVIDCNGKAIIPGFVDSHTHLLWDGDRADEMTLRLSGLSYADIAAQGGGIQKTVNSTRLATMDRLIQLGGKRIARAAGLGTTTMECKSGYGLSIDSELKLLEACNRLAIESQIDIHSTWLGAHDVPKDATCDQYVESLISDQLPKVAEQGLAKYSDVFCEPGWFTLEQTEQIVQAAKEYNIPSRLHVDEFVDGNGLQLASDLGAVSGDHVGHSSSQARASAANTGTMQTFLPGTPYILGYDLELPLRECVENQWQFSLATDFNPNCRSLSIPFVGSLATHRLGLNPLEALVAVTRNPATTLISSSEGELAGSLREGGPADLLILDSKYIDSWCQMPGDNPISTTIKSGSIV